MLLLACAPARAQDVAAGGESVHAAMCRLIDAAARRHDVPTGFFTRLLWQESSFRPHVTSPAGAQGIAQFMPGTASMRGLSDPFDPEQAIPASASLLAELTLRFGNRGLAAVAYNAGPGRAMGLLSGRDWLPAETEIYVQRITGRSARDWLQDLEPQVPMPRPTSAEAGETCLAATAALMRESPALAQGRLTPFAPWGVQLAGNFSKARALAAYRRSQSRYASILADVQPMIIGTRLRSRGTRAFYRVRAPAQSRREANALCERIRRAGGPCIVLKS